MASVECFLRERGLSEEAISKMLQRCCHLKTTNRYDQNWQILLSESGLSERKLPNVITRCPRLLVIPEFQEKLQCWKSLPTKPEDLASAIARFPRLLVYSIPEKLCPLLAFLQSVAGVPECRVSKLIMACPRLLSYSIPLKLIRTINFLSEELGIPHGSSSMASIICKCPYIFGYSVEARLRPTALFLQQNIGLHQHQLRTLTTSYPHILCRDADKSLRPNLDFLAGAGFDSTQVLALVSAYPPVLISSIRNSLKPKLQFVLKQMGKCIKDVADYPMWFSHSLNKDIMPRFRMFQQSGSLCVSLEDMLTCNQKSLEDVFKHNQKVQLEGSCTGKLAGLALSS